MNWLYYLLEANLYLAAFYLLYKLLLQNSTFYNSNRYFLVLSIVVAFTIPLIQLGFLKPQILLPAEEVVYDFPVETIELAKVAPAPTLTKEDYIIYGYLILAALLCLKFVLSIAKIIKIYAKSEKRELDGYTLVEVAAEHTAFSFFNILFIHPDMIKNNTVLRHEIIHIKQKHSWDIILLELLKIFCWFNPIVYLIKRDLTMLHEYIADERTTSSAISKHEYAMFLIENSMASYSPSLVNQFFNQSILKSRINMLNKEKTANWARLKYLLAVPLGVGLLCASTLSFSKSYGYDVFPAAQLKTKDEPSTQEKRKYYPKYKHDKDGNYISLEERIIVINGDIVKDKNKYYGTAEADKIVFLNSTDAIKKYGADKGKNGAVELYGEKVVHTFPPPVVKQDQVKFPPPIVKKNKAKADVKPNQVKFPAPLVKPENQSSFYPKNVYRDEKAVKVDPRVIVINGEIIADNSTFYGVRNTEEVVFIHPHDAAIKYGEKGKNGAVEISGSKAEKTPLTPPPPVETPPLSPKPPKVKKDQVKFPPPIAKPDKKASNAKKAELRKEIEVALASLAKKEKVQEIKIVPAQKPEEIKIEAINKSNSKPTTNKVEELEIAPTKPKESSKLIQKTNRPVATTTKTTPQNRNNVFTKAWTLYKPKVEEKKNDNC